MRGSKLTMPYLYASRAIGQASLQMAENCHGTLDSNKAVGNYAGMPIKMKLGELVNARDTLTKVSATKLPVKSSYWIARKLKTLSSELGTFDEKRNELIRELGAPDEKNPNSVVVKPENIQEYFKRLTEVLDIEVALEMVPFRLADLEGCELTPLEVSTLGGLIEEPALQAV